MNLVVKRIQAATIADTNDDIILHDSDITDNDQDFQKREE